MSDQRYLVSWKVEIRASSCAEAMQQARAMQVDPALLATSFEVQPVTESGRWDGERQTLWWSALPATDPNRPGDVKHIEGSDVAFDGWYYVAAGRYHVGPFLDEASATEARNAGYEPEPRI